MESKVIKCPIHGETEHKSEKQNKAGYIRWRCGKCSRQRQKKSVHKRKKNLVSAFGGCCVVCKYDKYIGALEFHHLDRNKKDFKISSINYSYKRAYEEAKKCILVCSNCHKEIEAGVKKI